MPPSIDQPRRANSPGPAAARNVDVHHTKGQSQEHAAGQGQEGARGGKADEQKKKKGTGKLFDEINAEDKAFSTSLLLFVLVKNKYEAKGLKHRSKQALSDFTCTKIGTLSFPVLLFPV